MFKKFNYFKKIFFVSILLFFSMANFCSALEVPLPNLPPNPTLPQYAAYWFQSAMFLGGLIALIGLIYGAIKYLISTGEPEKIGDAKKRMFAAGIGLIVLLTSWIIIQYINPQLAELGVRERISHVPGLYYITGNNLKGGAAKWVHNTQNIPSRNVKWVACDPNSPASNCTPAQYCQNHPYPYIVYQYGATNYENFIGLDVIPCNGQVAIRGQSYIIEKRGPGVYFYSGNNCAPAIHSNQLPRSPHTSSNPDFSPPSSVNSVLVVNGPDPQKGPFYGAFVHKKSDYRGRPRSIIPCRDWNNCQPVQTECYSPSNDGFRPLAGIDSITIYPFNPKNSGISSGDGVTFYTKANFDGAYKEFRDVWIQDGNFLEIKKTKEYPPVRGDEVELERCNGGWFTKSLFGHESCLNSVRIDGSYLVMLSDVCPSDDPLWAEHGVQFFPIPQDRTLSEEYKEIVIEKYDVKKGPINLGIEVGWKTTECFSIIPYIPDNEF